MPLRGGRIGSIKHTVGRPRVNPPRFWNATKRAAAGWHRPLHEDGGKLGAPSRSRIRRHHMVFLKSRGFHSLLSFNIYINILYLNTTIQEMQTNIKWLFQRRITFIILKCIIFFFLKYFLSLGNFKTRTVMTLANIL